MKKILITGASGRIGREALALALEDPRVGTVVTLVRRDLPDSVPASVRTHPKLRYERVTDADFAAWPDTRVLKEHADAAGMIWAMGSYNGSVEADLEYPLAFMENMARVLEETRPVAAEGRPPFQYVQLSGMFVRRDQDSRLWVNEKTRKLKGLLETRALAFATERSTMWRTFVVRPGGVVLRSMCGAGAIGVVTKLGAVLGENWSVHVEELGAVMVDLAVDGGGDVGKKEDYDPTFENARIVRRGRELLAARDGRT